MIEVHHRARIEAESNEALVLGVEIVDRNGEMAIAVAECIRFGTTYYSQ